MSHVARMNESCHTHKPLSPHPLCPEQLIAKFQQKSNPISAKIKSNQIDSSLAHGRTLPLNMFGNFFLKTFLGLKKTKKKTKLIQVLYIPSLSH